MKKIGLILLFLIFFSYFIVSYVAAQAPPSQFSQDWNCLRGDEKTFTFNGPSSTTFTQDLYGDGYEYYGDAYVVSCVGTEAGGVCSTGNPTYDNLIFNNDNTTLFPYSVAIAGGAKQKIILGKLKVTATVTTTGLTGGMAFFSVIINDPETTLGSGEGQKLSTFSFDDPTFTKCVTISWTSILPTPTPVPQQGGGDDDDDGGNNRPRRRYDPFGIIFDSQSLEPLPNISITIWDKNKNKYNLIGLTNPQTTKADGLFNFLVEPGTYFLTTTLPNSYSFTSNPNLHPNYIKIYHKDDGTNSIYKPDEPIVEEIDTPEEIINGKPNIEHRDIPLDPGSGLPFSAEPSTIVYKIVKLGSTTTIDGRVSHPYTDVNFLQGETLLNKTTADRFGYFIVDIDNNKIKQDENITINYVKKDLTKLELTENIFNKLYSWFANAVLSPVSRSALAQTRITISSPPSSLTIAPILSYIEGYAYDNKNNKIPYARILLKLKMNDAVYFETKADSDGFFQIKSRSIPIFPYYLEIITNKGDKNTYTTTEFAKQNKQYLSKSNINLIEPKLVNNSFFSKTPFSKIDSKIPPKPDLSKTKEQSSVLKPSNSIIIVLIIFILLIGAIFTAFFILRSKNTWQKFT